MNKEEFSIGKINLALKCLHHFLEDPLVERLEYVEQAIMELSLLGIVLTRDDVYNSPKT